MQRVGRVERAATATWTGTVARGRGQLSAPSGVLDALPFSLAGRIAETATEETSPEELLAAAHAACFAMALSARLTSRRAAPEQVLVTATSALDDVGGLNRVVAGRLDVAVDAPGITPAELDQLVAEADRRCPFSALLRDAGARVTVAAALSDRIPQPKNV